MSSIFYIDPGHGKGNRHRGLWDPGFSMTVGKLVIQEAVEVLKYSLELTGFLRALGHRVILSRETDLQEKSLHSRVAESNSKQVNAYVALHMNAFAKNTGTGTETLYDNAADKRLAGYVQRAVVSVLELPDRGLKQKPEFAVFGCETPTCLLELAFLDHDRDRALLLDSRVRTEVCRAIAGSLNAWSRGVLQ